MEERLSPPVQENCLAFLVHNAETGRIIANMVKADLFEGDYRIIAEKAIDYWRIYRQPPGPHIGDLLESILSDPKQQMRARFMRSTLIKILELAEHENVNPTYVLQQVQLLGETQRRKQAMLKCAELINSGYNMETIEKVDAAWNEIVHTKPLNFDPGMRLTDYEKILAYLDNRNTEFSTGIKEFDKRYCVPARAAVSLILAATSRGKSWMLVHLGMRAMMHRKKVAHVTLEMGAEETSLRYYQNDWRIPKHELREHTAPTFELDDQGKIVSIKEEGVDYDYSFDSQYRQEETSTRARQRAKLYEDYIRVKKFPMRGLSMPQLRAWLNYLEDVDGFLPDMLILDYIGITKTDDKNHRISLGRSFEDFKGICDDRNIAGVTAQQISRKGSKEKVVKMTDISEDWSLTNTADQVFTYSTTDMEFKRGLGRLYMNKNRSEISGFGVLLAQDYATGQFVLESTMLSKEYFELLDKMPKNGDTDDENGDDEN